MNCFSLSESKFSHLLKKKLSSGHYTADMPDSRDTKKINIEFLFSSSLASQRNLQVLIH